MAKIYNKIVESTTEPSKEDLWLKEGKIKKFKNGWEDISGKSDVKIPTKVSELENDCNFVDGVNFTTEEVPFERWVYSDVGSEFTILNNYEDCLWIDALIYGSIVECYVKGVLVYLGDFSGLEKHLLSINLEGGIPLSIQIDSECVYSSYELYGYNLVPITLIIKIPQDINFYVLYEFTGTWYLPRSLLDKLYEKADKTDLQNKVNKNELGTAAYKSVEELVELVKQSINA